MPNGATKYREDIYITIELDGVSCIWCIQRKRFMIFFCSDLYTLRSHCHKSIWVTHQPSCIASQSQVHSASLKRVHANFLFLKWRNMYSGKAITIQSALIYSYNSFWLFLCMKETEAINLMFLVGKKKLLMVNILFWQ